MTVQGNARRTFSSPTHHHCVSVSILRWPRDQDINEKKTQLDIGLLIQTFIECKEKEVKKLP